MEAALGIFVASLAGSAHCAAMCGPFVAFASAGPSRDGAGRGLATTAYHAGRLAAYLTLGVAAGALGAGVDRLGALAGVGRAAAILAGLLMVAWGLDTILALHGKRPAALHPPPVMQRALGAAVRRVGGLPSVARGGLTGLATALLPCGWLYAFVAAAGSTGSPVRGAQAMLLFWAGTLPVMVTLGFTLQRLAGPFRRALPLVTASVVVAIGLLTIAGRLRPPATTPAGVPAVHANHR